jgi:hypothetical protein
MTSQWLLRADDLHVAIMASVIGSAIATGTVKMPSWHNWRACDPIFSLHRMAQSVQPALFRAAVAEQARGDQI